MTKSATRKPPPDLDRARPDSLVDAIEPVDLARAVEALQDWSPHRLGVVDDVLSSWVPEAIARPNDREGVAALQSSVLRILDAPASRTAGVADPHPAQAGDFAQRWRGFADALDARHLTLEERNPDRVRRQKYVTEILGLVESGVVKQAAVQKKLAIAPARLSQVLSLMEAHALIERQKVGKENMLSIPERADPVAESKPALPDNVLRFASFLCKKAA